MRLTETPNMVLVVDVSFILIDATLLQAITPTSGC
jgi:hypothetical protein